MLVPLGINLSGGEIESTNAALNAPPDKTRQLPLASTSLKRSTGALHAYGTGCRACHAGKITPFSSDGTWSCSSVGESARHLPVALTPLKRSTGALHAGWHRASSLSRRRVRSGPLGGETLQWSVERIERARKLSGAGNGFKCYGALVEWLRRLPVTQEITGSIPVRFAIFHDHLVPGRLP